MGIYEDDGEVAYSAVSLVDGPAGASVGRADVKSQLNLTTAAHDNWIDRAIVAAEKHVQKITNRVLISSRFDAFYDRFPATGRIIELPKPDVSAVELITYNATDGTSTILPAEQYTVDTDSERGRIWEAYGFGWPSTRAIRHAVTIRFLAGYADAGAVPEDIKHAMYMLIAHWFSNRASVLVGTISKEIEFGVAALLAGYESHRFL